jgi:hypothetical protein
MKIRDKYGVDMIGYAKDGNIVRYPAVTAVTHLEYLHKFYEENKIELNDTLVDFFICISLLFIIKKFYNKILTF